MARRVLSFLLIIIMILSVVPFGVFAEEMELEEAIIPIINMEEDMLEEFSEDDFRIMETDENLFQFHESTGAIENYFGTYKNIAIPESIRGVKVIRIDHGAFNGKNLENVIISDSVTTIGRSAFFNNQLKSVIMSENITSIDGYAFSNNQLTSINIPKGVTRIGYGAFLNNKLTNVVIPDGITILENSVFADNQLTKVIIPNNITSIESEVFSNNQLTDIIIPDSVTDIGYRAFYNNPLKYISIPMNTRSIHTSDDTIPSETIIITEENSTAHAWGTDKGRSLQLVGKTATFDLKGGEGNFPSHTVVLGEPLVKPEVIPTKEGTIFKNWRTNKGDIYDFRTITEDTTIFADWEETLPDESPFEFDKSTGTITGYTGTEVNVVIPERIQGVGVKKIGDSAFSEKQLQSVIIPNSVIAIGDEAFSYNQLKEVNLPSSITSIGNKAFRYNQLQSIVIPNGVTSIGDFAFIANQLLKVDIPESVTSIGSHAFQANQLTKIILPDNIIVINPYTFAGNQLKNIIIPEGVIKIDGLAFYMNPLEYISIPRSTEIIDTTVAFPSSVIIIAEENSTAHTWAINNNMAIQLVGKIASFDLKGGKGNFPSHIVEPGEPLIKPNGIPTKEGAIFKNWWTNTEQIYDFRNITEDISIFPEWEGILPDDEKIVINHIDIDTNEILETETLIKELEDYTIDFENISGYTLAAKSLNLTSKDKITTIEFKYRKGSVDTHTATIIVKHIDTDTKKLLETETLIKELGTYTVNSKEITGYTLEDDGSKEVTLTTKDEEVIVEFKYKKDIVEPDDPDTAKIIVNHIDIDSKEVLETETLTKELGTYTVNSKEIPGYTLEDYGSKEVTLTTKDEEVTVEFEYKKDSVEPVEPDKPDKPDKPDPVIPDRDIRDRRNEKKKIEKKEEKESIIISETKSVKNGKTIVDVKVNNKLIESIIKNADKGNKNIILLPISDKTSDVVKLYLTGDIIKQLEDKGFIISIDRDNIQYNISSSEFKITRLSKELGLKESDLKDIQIEIQIEKVNDELTRKYEEIVNKNGSELLVKPIEFNIKAIWTKKDGTIEARNINTFSQYVERIIEIPERVEPPKTITGIVFDSNGSYSHIPTTIFNKDGKWYAKLTSLTNSTYSIISNKVVVKSVENHWSKIAVEDMASRLVIKSPENFDPKGQITRGEFAEYIAKALGIYRTGVAVENQFTDVNSANPLADAIKIAVDYGIVKGYKDGTFRPNANITREEAMVMFEKAIKVSELKVIDNNRIDSYADKDKVSEWAYSDVKRVLSTGIFNGTSPTTISPKDTFSYSEAATAIRNLLIEAGLINN